MRHNSIFSFLGWLIALLAAMMLLAMMMAFIWGERGALSSFFVSFAISAFIAGVMIFSSRQSGGKLVLVDLCLICALGWLVATIIATLPLAFYLQLPLAKNYFLATSALTTTGASIFSDGGAKIVPFSIQIWLILLQWLGGLATLVMAMVVLAPLAIGGMQLRQVPGTSHESEPQQGVLRAVKIILPIYASLTLTCFIFLLLGGLSFFDAFSLALTTISTSGMNLSLDTDLYQTAYVQLILAIFMLAGAVNMAQYYLYYRGQTQFKNDLEFQVFLVYIFAMGVAFAVLLLQGGWLTSAEANIVQSVPSSQDLATTTADSTPEELMGGFGAVLFDTKWIQLLGEGLFVAISIISTTGIGSVDIALPFLLILLLTFIGGMAVSTAGGIKMLRVLLLIRQGVKELSVIAYPHDVKGVYFDKVTIHINLMQTVWVFFALTNAIIAAFVLFLTFSGMSFEHSLSAAVALLSNAGPIVNYLGIDAARLYAHMSDLASWGSSLAMILGRVELMILLTLFNPLYWKKS